MLESLTRHWADLGATAALIYLGARSMGLSARQAANDRQMLASWAVSVVVAGAGLGAVWLP
jgi:hypothetical protein